MSGFIFCLLDNCSSSSGGGSGGGGGGGESEMIEKRVERKSTGNLEGKEMALEGEMRKSRVKLERY